MLTGDPTYWPKEKIDAYGNGTTGGAFNQWRDKYSLDGYKSYSSSTHKITNDFRSYCKPYDVWCQSCKAAVQGQPLSNCAKADRWGIHNSYGDCTTTGREISFLVQFE